jgi:CBS domain-containing protein
MAIAEMNLEEIVVRDIMTRGVATIQCDENVPKVAEIMTEEDISCIVVVDQADEAAGMISSLDIVRVFSEKNIAEIKKMTAEDIMTPFVVEANVEMTLKEIANIMALKNIHRVVVLSPVGRKPVGILSATDIVRKIS